MSEAHSDRVTDVIFADGSVATFTAGGAFHEGGLAIERIRLITLRSALTIELRTNGQMRLTGKVSAYRAVQNVLEPITGKVYKRSRKGKEEALADCEAVLAFIDSQAVVASFEEE